ncbi:hypothetical protein BVX98_05895 [bacterium F11]|nr:hypothetical protein BVX98_05895 [bacterium F11]
MSDKNVVYISANYIQAGIVKGFLESHGIEAHLFDENISRMHPFYNFAIGGVKVVVPNHQLKTARKLLKEQGKLDHFDRPVGDLTPFHFLGKIRSWRKKATILLLAIISLPVAIVARGLLSSKGGFGKGDG